MAEVNVIPEERRIYVMVPQNVDVTRPATSKDLWDEDFPNEEVIIDMEPGRLMAQCAHVVSQMRGEVCQAAYRSDCRAGTFDIFRPITTIVLSVRNSRELELIRSNLIEYSENGPNDRFGVYWFHDNNEAFYGTSDGVMTAVCTSPVYASEVDAVIGHLELYA